MTSTPHQPTSRPPRTGSNDPLGLRAEFLQRTRQLACSVHKSVERAHELDAPDINGDLAARVAVFSIGNAREAHGPCLPLDIDDRIGAHVAVAVANETGARYLGPIPYCTDTAGDLARSWSSAYLPYETFYIRVQQFINNQLAVHYEERGEQRPNLVYIVSGHGGNSALVRDLSRLAFECRVLKVAYGEAILDANIQHAGDVEHAVASQLGSGCFDRDALHHCNSQLASGDSECFQFLASYPTLAGMAGFYLFGTEAFDAVRTKYKGVKRAVGDVVLLRRISASAEVGRRVLAHTIRSTSQALLTQAVESKCHLPGRTLAATSPSPPSSTPDTQAVQIALIDEAGKILLQHRDDDAEVLPSHWGFFGGAIEPGEAPEAALAREAQEELQLTLPHMTYLGVVPHQRERSVIWSHLYVGHVCGPSKPAAHDQREGQGLGFFSWDDLSKLLIPAHDWASHTRLRRHLESIAS